MSLINDALKRASKKQKDGVIGSGDDGSLMTPVESSSGGGPNFVLIGLLLVCLVAGGYYFMKWKQAGAKGNAAVPAQTKATPAPTNPPKNGILGAASLIRGTTNLVGQIRARQNADTSMIQHPASTNATTTSAAKTNAPAAPTNAIPPEMKPEVGSSEQPPEPAPAVVQPRSPAGTFPNLKLQGIFYRLKNPTVLINGETWKTGDLINGVKLVEIDRTSVKVEWNSQTKVLLLPQ